MCCPLWLRGPLWVSGVLVVSSPAATEIVIDGRFDDWSNVPAMSDTDPPPDASVSEVVRDLKIAHSDEYLFMRFSLALPKEVLLNGNAGLRIYLNGRGETGVAVPFHGFQADMVLDCRSGSGEFYIDDQALAISVYDVGFVGAPTYSSREFEVGFERDAQPRFGHSVIESERVQIAIVLFDPSSAEPVGTSPTLNYSMRSPALERVEPISSGKDHPAHIRLVSLNVAGDGIFDEGRVRNYARILKSLRPDIVAYQEIYERTEYEMVTKTRELLGDNSGEWFGARLPPDIGLVSRFPIRAFFPLEKCGAFLLNLAPRAASDLLILNAHTTCCGGEERRQREIDGMLAFIRDALNGTSAMALAYGTPVFIVGDLNLVTSSRQLTSITRGDVADEASFGPDFAPDWDGTDLADALPRHTHTPFTFTWSNPGDRFFPGRLDFALFTDSVVELQKAFVLDSVGMSPGSRTDLGLALKDTMMASDHLPLVLDFTILHPD